MKSAAPYFMFNSGLAGSTILFIILSYSFFSHVALRPNAGHGLLILQVYISQYDAPLLVGLL